MVKALEEYNPDEDRWLLAEAETEAGPLFIRLNTTAKDFVAHPRLNIKLGFCIPLEEHTDGDLPNAEQNAELATVEDQIIETVAEGATGIHVLTLTNGQMKELIFYIEPDADIAAMHQFLMKSVKNYEVQCMAVREPEWETYLEFSPN